MNFNKQRFLEIIITALISASIAFLQSMMSAHLFQANTTDTVALAGVLGGVLRSMRIATCTV
jgi:hypothetical protein